MASLTIEGLSWLSRVKMKVGPPMPYSPLEDRTTPAPTSSLTRWLAAMTTFGFPDRHHDGLLDDVAGPARSPGNRLAKASETSSAWSCTQ